MLNKFKSSVLLDQFGSHFEEIGKAILTTEYHSMIGVPCNCSVKGRIWTTRCNDCFQLPLTCEQCFLQQHENQPFHWVRKWNGNFFVRCNISSLGYIVVLGHHGKPCPNNLSLTSLIFIVVHTNGIHKTRVKFCNCIRRGDRMQQLLSAQLFPAITEQPTTPFTFGLLWEFHIHSLQSKSTVYSYIGGLRCLTDNMFTTDVSVH